MMIMNMILSQEAITEVNENYTAADESLRMRQSQCFCWLISSNNAEMQRSKQSKMI